MRRHRLRSSEKAISFVATEQATTYDVKQRRSIRSNRVNAHKRTTSSPISARHRALVKPTKL